MAWTRNLEQKTTGQSKTFVDGEGAVQLRVVDQT
jgi:hypothetical protein